MAKRKKQVKTTTLLGQISAIILLAMASQVSSPVLAGMLVLTSLLVLSMLGIAYMKKKRIIRADFFKRKMGVMKQGVIVGTLVIMYFMYSNIFHLEASGTAFLIFAFVIISIFVSALYAIKRYRINRILSSGIQDIDLMTGSDFEKFLESFFTQKGYKVFRTPTSGDFGADLIIQNDVKKIAIQVKRYNDKVGLQAVQEVVGAMAHYSCQKGMVITNSYYTKQAKKLAESNNVLLWDREELIGELLSRDKKNLRGSNQ